MTAKKSAKKASAVSRVRAHAKPHGVSRSAAAKALNVDPGTITKWSKKGWLVLHSDRSVDVEATAVRVDSMRSKTRGGREDRGLCAVAPELGKKLAASGDLPSEEPDEPPPIPPADEGVDFNEARRRREYWASENERLKAQKQAGDLVDAAEAQAAFVQSITMARSAVEAVAARVAPRLVGLASGHEIRVIIAREIDDALRTLADA